MVRSLTVTSGLPLYRGVVISFSARTKGRKGSLTRTGVRPFGPGVKEFPIVIEQIKHAHIGVPMAWVLQVGRD